MNAPAKNLSLSIKEIGNLDSLYFMPTQRSCPAEDEVEIEVYCAALNFKDILYSLGKLTKNSTDPLLFGYECVGKIVTLGEKVSHYKLGDWVIALCPNAISQYVTVPTRAVTLKPRWLNCIEAATIPVAFVTAYHALVKIAQIKQGQRILIHAATGGVGLAAVQIAQSCEAEIFATAGTDEKRGLLQTLGVPHIASSRDLSFVKEFSKQIENNGFNVILNSLTGDLFEHSLKLLAPYGHFLELGHRDIYSNTKTHLLNELPPGASFSLININPQMPDLPDLLNNLTALFLEETYQPLIYQVFDADDIQNAFQYMISAKHVGKIIIKLKDGDSSVSSEFEQFFSQSLENRIKKGITNAEGALLLQKALDLGVPRLIIAKSDFKSRVKAAAMSAPAGTILNNTSHSTSSSPSDEHVQNQPSKNSTAKATDLIADVWAEVLGLPAINPDENFFDLGGNSLLAIQLCNKLYSELDLQVPPYALLIHPTVSLLQNFLNKGNSAAK